MDYRYHCQHQAESFANSIIPVPGDYPLRNGLPEDFREHFKELCKLAKDIYMDMAKQPENYGLMLLDINETDHNRARDSYRTIHRFMDTLNVLFLNGEVRNHCLTVNAEEFREAAKKITKYGLILSRLCDFGFFISDFESNVIDKNAVTFSVEYPDSPNIVEAIKIYCEDWMLLEKTLPIGASTSKGYKGLIRLGPWQFRHHFYRYDYKITADLAQVSMLTWVNDEADYYCFSEQLKRFNEAFYLESLKYKSVKFDGDYSYKGKRIARITQVEFDALGKSNYRLSLKLPKPDSYMDVIKTMPDKIKEMFSKDRCSHCVMQCADGSCKMRLYWTYDGEAREGCSCLCFNYGEFDIALLPDYWRLLELQYKLKKDE